MRYIVIVLTTILLANPLIANNNLPIGNLGYSVGTYLTVEGKRYEGRLKGDAKNTLLVNKVNGTALDDPTIITINNLGDKYLPEGINITLKGYESGNMVGIPKEVMDAEGIEIEPQTYWHFSCYFIMTSCINPEQLPVANTNQYIESYPRRRGERRGKNTSNH